MCKKDMNKFWDNFSGWQKSIHADAVIKAKAATDNITRSIDPYGSHELTLKPKADSDGYDVETVNNMQTHNEPFDWDTRYLCSSEVVEDINPLDLSEEDYAAYIAVPGNVQVVIDQFFGEHKLTDREADEECYVNLYKSVYNCKPKSMNIKGWSDDRLTLAIRLLNSMPDSVST